MISKALKNGITAPIMAIILLVTFLVIIAGMIIYNSQKKKIVTEKQNELATIATFKIADIEKWRMEHIRDGQILRSIIPRNQLIFDFLKNDSSRKYGKELLERVRLFTSGYDYHSFLLIDTTGSIRLVYPQSDKLLALNIPQLRELQDPNIIISDLHFSDDLSGNIHIDLQIPLFTTVKDKTVRFGTLIMMIDPEKTLYPLIQSWPTASKSSETLLVRREGDSVLFLNELRHLKNTALKLKMPLKKKSPASMAVLGKEGMFEGIDYRGIPVISFLKRIPGSPWFMVAKVDTKEIYSPLKNLILVISIIAFLIILKAILLILYISRNQRFRYVKELNSTKDKFFSIVSHDLRSPFTSIKGFADILVENLQNKNTTNIDDDNIKKYAEIIRDSSQNAVDLLRNLTEWSRLSTDRVVFNPAEIDLVLTIDEVIDFMNVAAVQKSIVINKTLPSGLKVFADKEMISLVLRNLISNSIKFTNPGGSIHISVLERDEDIIVEVSDTGVGIEKEIADKLFRIEDNVTTPGTLRERGTGLGLILVKEFISLHGGQVHVESEVGKYSRISFNLPTGGVDKK